MIDPKTGEIQLPAEGIRIGPVLTHAQFLASECGGRSQVLVNNPPYLSYTLPATQFEGRSFAWSLSFRGEILQSVEIACNDPEFGRSWDDWSEELELSRKRLHDALLESALGSNWQRRYPWGEVDSAYDSRSGGSSIHVQYLHRNSVGSWLKRFLAREA